MTGHGHRWNRLAMYCRACGARLRDKAQVEARCPMARVRRLPAGYYAHLPRKSARWHERNPGIVPLRRHRGAR